MKRRTLGHALLALATLALLVGSAPAVLAADGEIGDVGDTDSITDLKVNGSGHVYADVDYVKDCPPGMSCAIDVNFGYKCPEAWCLGYTYQGWKPLPAPSGGVSRVLALCNGGQDIDNYWQILYRVHWWAPQRTTTTTSGEVEAYIKTDGTIGYRLIAEAGFNESLKAGLKTSQVIETTTATFGYTPENGVVVATSKGLVYHTC